jgi:hypothetical protein
MTRTGRKKSKIPSTINRRTSIVAYVYLSNHGRKNSRWHADQPGHDLVVCRSRGQKTGRIKGLDDHFISSNNVGQGQGASASRAAKAACWEEKLDGDAAVEQVGK